MNAKILRLLAAALVVTSLAPAAIAESLGEHPSVLVARAWSSRGIDPNTFIVAHPARLQLLAVSPAEKDTAAREHATRAANAVSVR